MIEAKKESSMDNKTSYSKRSESWNSRQVSGGLKIGSLISRMTKTLLIQ